MRKIGILAAGILAAALTGCRNDGQAADAVWESPDGAYTLMLDETMWKVEEESEGEYHFTYEKDEKFTFSVSKWENLQFPEEFDYESYYSGYVEEIRLGFPDVESTGLEMIRLEDTEIVQMGVRYEVLEVLCQITTSMIAVPDSEDTLCFVAIYPAEKSKEQETIFRNIVTGIEFLQ